jgi:hypothetical protein
MLFVQFAEEELDDDHRSVGGSDWGVEHANRIQKAKRKKMIKILRFLILTTFKQSCSK